MKKPKLLWESEPFGPKCAGCAYQPWSRHYVPPEIKDSRVVLLGEAAAYWECLEGMPFAGRSGGKLNHWLGFADLTRLDVDIVNSCRCRPVAWELCDICQGDGEILREFIDDNPQFDACDLCDARGWTPVIQGDGDYRNATPEPDQISECMRRYGHETLRGLKRKKLIVALGGSALYALTGKSSLGDYSGSVLDTEHGPALITYHPASALYSDEFEPAAIRAFTRIPAIVAGTEGAGLEVTYLTHPSHEDIDEYRTARSFVLDLETTGGMSPEASAGDIKVAGASLRPGHAITVLPGSQLRELLESCDSVTGQYFYAYDAWWLHHRSYPVPPTIVDTQVLGHAVDPLTPNDITFLTTQYAEPPLKSYWKSETDYAEDLGGVALRDVDATSRIERGLWSWLRKQSQLDLANDVIIPWTRLAFELRRDGLRCNVAALRDGAKELDREVRDAGQKLSSKCGIPLPKKSKTGIPSPQAITKHLYSVLGLPVQKHRKTGKVTGDERALKKLRSWCWKHGHSDGLYFLSQLIGAPAAIEGEWEQGLKQRSTMVKDLKKFAGEDDGTTIRTLHAFVNLTGTVTGRLSYERPGLHQVPKHCRSAFLPDHDDHVLIEFDYKQIEFLTMLWFAGEWEKLRLGLSGIDFHRYAASLFYGVAESSVTQIQRRNVKALNFGMIFGKGVKTTAEDLDVSFGAAQKLYDRWFEMFPGVPKLRSTWTSQVSSLGYLQTPAGWRVRFNKDQQENTHRGSVTTQIYNYPIQSTAGIRTREALVNLWRELSRLWSPDDVRFVLTVHDSGIVSARKDLVKEVIEVITEVATAPYKHLPADIPGHRDGLRFPIDVKVGPSWGELTKC